MNVGFGKFYAKTFTGSMRGAGSHVIAVMGYAIANAIPPDGSVELEVGLLSFLIGDTPDRIQLALDYLCAPDPNSRTKTNEGRRLIKTGQFEYRLVNFMEHRNAPDDEMRKTYFANKQAEYRERKRTRTAETEPLITEPLQAVTSDNPPLCKALLDGEPVKGTKREDATERCRRMQLEATEMSQGNPGPTAPPPRESWDTPEWRAMPQPESMVVPPGKVPWVSMSPIERASATRGVFHTPKPTPPPPDARSPMQRICDWFKRRHSTKWSDKELRVFKECVLETHPEDLAILDAYYTADIPKDKDYRRHEIQTLLNNWNGEIDKAKQWKEGRFTPAPQTINGIQIEREYQNDRKAEARSLAARGMD